MTAFDPKRTSQSLSQEVRRPVWVGNPKRAQHGRGKKAYTVGYLAQPEPAGPSRTPRLRRARRWPHREAACHSALALSRLRPTPFPSEYILPSWFIAGVK